ncbi:hypothetical protein RJ035_000229 [Blastomyces gilchristii]
MPEAISSPDSDGSSFDPYTSDITVEQTHSYQQSNGSAVDMNASPSFHQQSQVPAVSTDHAADLEDTNLTIHHRFPSQQRNDNHTHLGQIRKRKRSTDGLDMPLHSSEYPVETLQGLGGSPSMDSHEPHAVEFPQDSFKRLKSNELNGPYVPPTKKIQNQGTASFGSMLPGEIWQHIFTFLPPTTLGRLLCVNKTFRSLLTPSEAELPGFPQASGLLKYLNPNSIWSVSRRAFHPGMPRPMSFLTELEMWNLISGSNCQLCGKLSSCSSLTDSTIWEAGPGLDGVSIIWPFGIRSCGECIQVKSEKEMDLLFSSNLPSMLIPSLPFAFFTPSMHFISSITLRNNQPPGDISLTKRFYKVHIDDMRRKFEDVKSLGPAATEEWIKGLEGNGKDKLADAARWEQWEASGGIRSVRLSRGNRNEVTWRLSSMDSGAKHQPVDTTSGHHSGHSGNSTPLTNDRVTNNDQRSPASLSNTSGSKLPPLSSSRDSSQPLPSSSSAHHPRTERSLREVNEAKASRKAEIERRCLELVPPLTPAVLSHMDSFSAAIQIPHPFTDRDWDILKPRLLSQRDVAERRERYRIKQDQLLQAKSEERRQHDAQFKEAKEQQDREWDEAQKPIRERMASYADEIIREGWRGGDAVTKEKSAKFAADVLIYVKDKFYRDLAQEDAKARNAGKPIPEDPPGAPPTRKLILENMKFIFDTKIKPLTEQFQKELFLCNGNGCEANTKFYGFEGVIQHYAAKHTNVLSLGSVVVHWRAEWPEHSPFHPNPTAAKALFFAMPRPTVGHTLGYPNPGAMYMPGSDQGHHHPSDGGPGYPQPSPGPYNRTPYGTPYAYGSGPYRPPSPAPPFYPNQPASFPYSVPQPGYAPSGAYDPYGPPQPPNPVYGSPYPGQAYPPPYPPPPDSRAPQPYQPPPYPPPTTGQPQYCAPYPTNSHPPRRGGAQGHNSNPNSQAFGMYQVQLDDVAKNARSVWNGTSGIKDLPHNVRAHVLIHHVVSRFVERFGHEPQLTLFADGLSSHAQMRPIKNLSGLVCKTCNDNDISGRQHHHDAGRTDRKIYTLPALVSHFQSMHVDRTKPTGPHSGREPRLLEWQYDMLLVPDNQTISELVDAPGMDDAKMQLISAAFPWVFPQAPSISHTPASNLSDRRRPEPRDSKQSKRSYPGNTRAKFAEQKATEPKSLSSPNHGLEVVVDDFPRFVESPANDANQPPDPPKDDEYDPHRPAFIEPVKDQHGRVDTRRSRQNQPSTIPAKDRIHNMRDQDQTSSNRYPARTKFHRAQPSDVDRTKVYPYADRHQHHQSDPLSKPASQYGGRPPKSEYPHSAVSGSVTAEPLNESQKIKTPVRNVSEDGEVEEASHSQERRPPRGIPLHEEMTDAERFLSSFVPGQETEEYKKAPSRGSERRTDEAPRGKWLEGPEPDDRRWRIDGGTAESSVSGTPTHSKQRGNWNRVKSPTIGGFRGDYEPKHEHYASSRHGDERSPEPTDIRHGRKPIGFSEPRHQSDYQTRRPHSRFDRYEAQRQGSHRPRSRSPIARDSLPVEPTYYRDRSPMPPRVRQRPVYATHASDPYHDRGPTEQNVAYTRLPPRGTYQYVEEPRYLEPPYDGTVEYIPVRVGGREHQNTSAYYIERPVQREVSKEYVDYEVDYPRQPGLIEPQGQYYPGETVSPNAHGGSSTVPRHLRYG